MLSNLPNKPLPFDMFAIWVAITATVLQPYLDQMDERVIKVLMAKLLDTELESRVNAAIRKPDLRLVKD